MKLLLKILFVIFLIWMGLGAYLESIEHTKSKVVVGLGVLFLSFILMPLFIYYRYKGGKYKKYVIKDNLFFPKKDQNKTD